jgi:hypothetical protein
VRVAPADHLQTVSVPVGPNSLTVTAAQQDTRCRHCSPSQEDPVVFSRTNQYVAQWTLSLRQATSLITATAPCWCTNQFRTNYSRRYDVASIFEDETWRTSSLKMRLRMCSRRGPASVRHRATAANDVANGP